MRLSSAQFYTQGLVNITSHQIRLEETQQQIASGRRVLKPSDDPSGSAQMLELGKDLANLEQYGKNNMAARQQLTLEESVLAQGNNVLQRVRELVIQANNSTQNVQNRKTIANEMSVLQHELLALANTKDASGDYIFGGYQVESLPFALQNGSFTYNGDQGQRHLQIGESARLAVRDSGAEVFQKIALGNGRYHTTTNASNSGNLMVSSAVAGNFVRDTYTLTYTQASPGDPVTYSVQDSSAVVIASGTHVSGETLTFNGVQLTTTGNPGDGDSFTIEPSRNQDIFTTIQEIVDVLEDSGADNSAKAYVSNNLSEALHSLDQAIDHNLEIRASVGIRLSSLETQQTQNDEFQFHLQQALSEIQDLDYAAAISRLNLQITALQAAQQSYLKLQGLSLFDYM